ncbi:Hsp70 family protein [Actinokineospora globicatena]|uniref:Molecular chaperone Hsp70 n=1 Tax=Actinokineospora globicatena TaxID=103729 RepID=A0A9W6QN51_9PSEU|nr:Hsp70 family protein [Actinokineospora globicatena]GLW91539.1 molecular chaperone Hsp70 [Actinokineospora globicatena]
MNVLSVDLGTSNTVAVLSAHGRPPRVVDVDGASMMPSAVFAGEDGGLVVGRDAERRARLDPSRFEPNPKRRVDEGTLLLGDTVVPVTDALAGVLRRVADETSRQLGGKKPDEVRLTHPAQWGPVRRNVLLSAARQAGMGSNLVLVPEPVAAAAHFASFPGQTLGSGQALAVYDLGAGTFDVAIVGATQNGFVVLAEAGLPDLGGLDVDQALLEHVGRQVSHRDPAGWQRLLRPESTGDRRAQRALREDVKASKEALSRHPQTEVPLPEPFDDVLVTRVELEALIRPGMLRSVELLAATIRSTGMTPDRLVGIYLVGGSSRIPLVATLIAEQLRVVPTSLDQPETAVALGAHHVPQEGITMRTGDMSSTIDAVRRSRATTVPPRTSGFNAQAPQAPQQQAPQTGPTPAQQYPSSSPQRVQGPPSRPIPVQSPQSPPSVPTPVQSPPSIPTPVQHHAPMQHQPLPAQRQNSNKVWYMATAIIAVVVIGIVSVIIATSGGSSLAADCDDKTTDAQGFTPCMREVAGHVANRDCSDGMNINGALQTPGAVAVTCKPDSGTYIVYCQFDSEGLVDDNIEEAFSTIGSQGESGSWDGGGMSGKYQVADIGSGAGLLMFTVTDTPIMGTVMVLPGSDYTGDLLEFFNEHVKPGSGT